MYCYVFPPFGNFLSAFLVNSQRKTFASLIADTFLANMCPLLKEHMFTSES